MNKTKALIVRLTPEEHKRLKYEALDRNMTYADLIKQAIKLYIETYTIETEKNKTPM